MPRVRAGEPVRPWPLPPPSADLPLSASRTTLRIEVRRFYCRNPTCRRRTFAETPLTLLTLRARRTPRLCEAQARVGRACGGAGGARLLAHLHMPASRATVLRLVTRMPMPDTPAPIRVGIDDWAIRKGSRYGTIVVDLDRRRVVDLLPDRTAPAVAGWLARHPASHSSPGIARSSTREAQASALPRRNRSPIAGTCSPTCGRPSNAGSPSRPRCWMRAKRLW